MLSLSIRQALCECACTRAGADKLPLPDEQMFRYEAMDDILGIVAQNPTEEFSNTELQNLTGFGGPSVSKALSLLISLGILVRRDTGRKTLYRIDEQCLAESEDPLLSIAQEEFRTPLRSFINQTTDAVESVAGILCFGSVARGEADRASDIDVFVLVNSEDELLEARRKITEIKKTLQNESFNGDRYEFEIFVESPSSTRNRGEDLRSIFREGIVLYKTETLETVKKKDLFTHGDR